MCLVQDFFHKRPNHIHEDGQGHVYQYIDDYDTAIERGVKRKSGFQSNSTMDVRMKEKDYDRRRLLNTVKN